MSISVNHIDTVVLENSDDRLAKVEEAKRTGNALESVSTNGSEVVQVELASVLLEDATKEDIYVGSGGRTFAGHLQNYHESVRENPDVIGQTNEEKAAAHEAYAAQYQRDRIEADRKAREVLAEDPDRIARAILAAQEKAAAEYEERIAQFTIDRRKTAKTTKTVDQVVDETVRQLEVQNLYDASSADRIEAFRSIATIPDVSESATKDALKTKDQIISTEIDFKSEAATYVQTQVTDYPAVSEDKELKVTKGSARKRDN